MSARKPQRNGKPASAVAAPRSTSKGRANQAKLVRLLASIYNQYQRLDDPKANKQCRFDFVFHMTDWRDDLFRLAELYQNPDQFDRDTAAEIVARFAYHATHHIMEAARLLLDYEPGYFFDSPKPKKSVSPSTR